MGTPLHVEDLCAGCRDVREFRTAHAGVTTGFSEPDMVETFSLMFRRRQVSLGVYEGSSLRGIAAWPVDWKGPVGIAQRLPIPYVGLVAEAADVAPHIRMLQRALAKRRIGRAFYSFPPQLGLDVEELRTALDRAGMPAWIRPSFSAEPRHGGLRAHAASAVLVQAETCILAIGEAGDEEGFIAALPQPRLRTSLRRTLGVMTARDANEDDIVRHLPRLLEVSYGRAGQPVPYPPGAFEVLWRRHGGDPDVVMRTLVQATSGDLLGIAVTVTRNSQAHNLFLARDYTTDPAVNVSARLVTDAAAAACARGCATLDLGGGTEGIRGFKVRLGAVRHPYVDVEATHPLYKPLFDAWRSARSRTERLRVGRPARRL